MHDENRVNLKVTNRWRRVMTILMETIWVLRMKHTTTLDLLRRGTKQKKCVCFRSCVLIALLTIQSIFFAFCGIEIFAIACALWCSFRIDKQQNTRGITHGKRKLRCFLKLFYCRLQLDLWTIFSKIVVPRRGYYENSIYCVVWLM